MRKAEQRWPAESKADDRTSTTTCSASAGRIDHHRVEAAGFGDEGYGRAAAREAAGKLLFDQSRDRRRAGEHDPLDARVGDQRRANFAGAGHELQRIARDARFMQHAHGFGGDERRLLGGLGDDGIAGRERGGDLAREDGERKVPGTDADDEAERGRGAGKQRARRLVRVVAQEVGRLAHFRDRVGVRLAGFAHDEANERVVSRFEEVGGAAQDDGALRGRDRGESGGCAIADVERRGDFVSARMPGEADDVAPVRGVQDRLAPLVLRGARRKGAPGRLGACVQSVGELGEAFFVGEIEPARVDAIRRIEIAGRRNLVVRRPERLDRAGGLNGIGDKVVDGHARVGDAVHERGVGAVLEQPADEIGEQGLVRADRRVDPARTIELVAADHLLVERFAHAVQALEFVLAAIEIGTSEDEHGSERLRIVGGELRIDRVRRREQFARAGEIAHIGVDLAGEHRKAVEAVDLRALDLRIPIGALDQADHQPAAASGARDRSASRRPPSSVCHKLG